MGRKKRKATEEPPTPEGAPPLATVQSAGVPPVGDPRRAIKLESQVTSGDSGQQSNEGDDKESKPQASGYAMTTHSAEIVDEDIYVSDGSDDDEDEKDVEVLLAGSRMGIMRRGIHHPMLVQPNRQWVRDDPKATGGEEDEKGDEEAEQKRQQEREEELAKLDPAQRAARLLAEKQRKLEEAKEESRHMESEENAGRDPCLFSKRTAFDIRFDQIEDKPWTRGGDFTDFFNYGLTEEDWLEYSQQQLMIRQELTDASRQRRPADPAIVPVAAREPSKQAPKVAVAQTATGNADGTTGEEGGDASGPQIGPVLVKNEGATDSKISENKGVEGPSKPDSKTKDIHVGAGSAWGAEAEPNSMLAKLIADQQRREAEGNPEPANKASAQEDSIYGPGGSHDDHHGGWNQQADHQSSGDHDYSGGRSGQSAAQQDFRGNRGQSYGGQSQNWEQNNYRGGRGGRGFYGGRGGGGRGGRGGYRDRQFQGRGGSQWDGGDSHYQRQRQRDDHDNRGWRR